MEEFFSIETVLTAGGAVAAAGFIKGLISIIKNVHESVGSFIQERKLEPVLAFAFSAVLVVVAALSAETELTVQSGFLALLAWYGIARLSMGIHDDLAGNPNSLSGPRIGSVKSEIDNDPPAIDISTTEDESRPTGPITG